MSRIFIDGSSAAYGLHDTAGGWSGRLKTTMNERIRLKTEPTIDARTIPPHADVLNSALRGRTLPEVRKWLPTIVNAHNSSKNIGVFMFNADIFRPQGSSEPQVSPERFSQEVEYLLEDCVHLSMQPIFLGSTDFNEARTRPYIGTKSRGEFRLSDKEYYNDLIQKGIATIAAANAIYLDIPGYFEERFPSKDEYHNLLAGDGLHLRNLGHQLIHDDLLLPTIDTILQEK